jgi:hypothetical protein
MRREGWCEVGPGMSVPINAVTCGPDVGWHHIDGPLLTWAGSLHWLTFGERLRIFFRRATVDQVACERWPHLAKLRHDLQNS